MTAVDRPVVWDKGQRRWIMPEDHPPPPCPGCGGDLEWRHKEWPPQDATCKRCWAASHGGSGSEGQAASACAAPSGSEADRGTDHRHTGALAGFVLLGSGQFGSSGGDGCHDQVPDCPASDGCHDPIPDFPMEFMILFAGEPNRTVARLGPKPCKRARSAVESPGTPDEEVLWGVLWDPEEQWAYRVNDRGQSQWATKLLVPGQLDDVLRAVFEDGREMWVDNPFPLSVHDWLVDGDTAIVKKKIEAWLGPDHGSGLEAFRQKGPRW